MAAAVFSLFVFLEDVETASESPVADSWGHCPHSNRGIFCTFPAWVSESSVQAPALAPNSPPGMRASPRATFSPELLWFPHLTHDIYEINSGLWCSLKALVERERNQMSKGGEQGRFRAGKHEEKRELCFKQNLGQVYPVWEVWESHGWGKRKEERFGARLQAAQDGLYSGEGESLPSEPLYNESLLCRNGSSWLCLIPAPRSLCCWIAVGYQAFGCAAQLFHILSKILVPLLFFLITSTTHSTGSAKQLQRAQLWARTCSPSPQTARIDLCLVLCLLFVLRGTALSKCGLDKSRQEERQKIPIATC